MQREQAKGIVPACMTIWKDDQSFDVGGMEKYVRWLLDEGAHALSICGSTGENITMSMEDQKKVIETVCGYVGGEVPIYAGTGRYTTIHTLELSKYAQKCGADGVMVILPYYLVPHKRAVLDHYRALRSELDIDIMVYNNPWFAGYELNVEEVGILLDEGVIHSIKAAHGCASRVHDLKCAYGDRLKVFYGHDYCMMEAFFAKADGWLSGLPAIFPRKARELYDICTIEKDIEKANKLLYRMLPFVNYFMHDKAPDGYPHWQEIFKYVLACEGLDVGLPRKPLGELDDAEKKKIDALIAPLMS